MSEVRPAQTDYKVGDCIIDARNGYVYQLIEYLPNTLDKAAFRVECLNRYVTSKAFIFVDKLDQFDRLSDMARVLYKDKV